MGAVTLDYGDMTLMPHWQSKAEMTTTRQTRTRWAPAAAVPRPWPDSEVTVVLRLTRPTDTVTLIQTPSPSLPVAIFKPEFGRLNLCWTSDSSSIILNQYTYKKS